MYSKLNHVLDLVANLFLYKRGVQQGCLLSPLLFALFLNDFVSVTFTLSLFLNDFNNVLLDSSERVRLWDTRVCAMLYADDLIPLAETSEDLQLQMYQLGIYAKI